MGELLEQPGVRERATEERSVDKTLSSSAIDLLRVTEHGHTHRRISNG